MGCADAKGWEKNMSDLERLYGNGVVYVSDGKMVSEFSWHNFDIESLENYTGIDFFITGEVVVAVGAGCTSKKRVAFTYLMTAIGCQPNISTPDLNRMVDCASNWERVRKLRTLGSGEGQNQSFIRRPANKKNVNNQDRSRSNNIQLFVVGGASRKICKAPPRQISHCLSITQDLDMSQDYLADLNKQQRQAVKYGSIEEGKFRSGPLLVIAGAGSGKTKTLAHRVAHLIVNGIDPARILLLTFSRRAALEMIQRADRITANVLGVGTHDLPWSGTFHAVGARLLREYASQIGLKPSFTILDRSDAADLMNLVRHDLRQSTKETRFPKKDTCLAIYSFAVNSGKPLTKVLAKQFPWCAQWENDLCQLFAAYTEIKQKQNVVDYDDLLLFWAAMMGDSEIAKAIGDRFDHVLVDEYQDTNRLQANILLGLKPNGQGLMVVGDDAQAIYSFRAATNRNILDFPEQFSPPAKVITLEQNYRSTQPILDAANAVIEFAKERFTKNLFSERQSKEKPGLTIVDDTIAQARYVAEQILKARGKCINDDFGRAEPVLEFALVRFWGGVTTTSTTNSASTRSHGFFYFLFAWLLTPGSTMPPRELAIRSRQLQSRWFSGSPKT